MAQNGKTDERISRDTLALIIGGLFVLALVFAAYTYFNRGRDISETFTNRLEDILTDDTERDGESTGSESAEGGDQGTKDTGTTPGTGGPTEEWIATNYVWEIAEAVYGDGTQWTRILEANSSKVGYLPNGQQALIITGQVLVIP
ncbi:MAG: hypothetical protein UU77_C0023G0019 [candidate division WWE3 bacterium GW2011_GWC1_41_7]|uniref:Uncharacterized protein n=1 Tax=candidate division WWE3 bacterium GW2011_GWC1_41_7 TaxID=1619119 RepID=A0A0G0X6N1_UNCKA|nr:MAG: hypothetical protein UU77_C0023G0019 [candidate division WWE3 bacterium GW2011_GWC1_41_7]